MPLSDSRRTPPSFASDAWIASGARRQRLLALAHAGVFTIRRKACGREQIGGGVVGMSPAGEQLIDDDASGRRDEPVLLPVTRVDYAACVGDRLSPINPRQMIDVDREIGSPDGRGRERDLARARAIRSARRRDGTTE